MLTRNRLGNARNQYQGKFPRVLTVCSAGMLRSPTIAWVLSNDPWNFNTRAVGVSNEYALTQIDGMHVAWADDIIVVEPYMADIIKIMIEDVNKISWDPIEPRIFVWDIPDIYSFRDKKLVRLVKDIAHQYYGTQEPPKVTLYKWRCRTCDHIWDDTKEAYVEGRTGCRKCNSDDIYMRDINVRGEE